MIDRTRHLEWSEINDFADGVLSVADAQAVAAHLATCDGCRSEHASLASTLGTLADGSVAPVPDGLWDRINESIDARPAATHSTSERRELRVSMPALAAAASLLIVASVATTLYVDRMRTDVDGDSTLAAVEEATTLQLTATDVQFVPGVEALERQLQSQRELLQPQTILIIERSLATIDSALVEARAALIADPANAALRDVLETTYRQKLDFLTRATKIAVGS
jgi:anti-sigma factor RsiW